MASVYEKNQAWHTADLPDVMLALNTTEGGLFENEALERLQKWGPNKLPQQNPTLFVWIFLRQFRNPLIYILLFAAVVSMVIGDLKDASFIVIVLAINAAIGSYQEWHAEQSSNALKKLLQIRAFVIRNSEVREINAEEVVPGDVVWLE